MHYLLKYIILIPSLFISIHVAWADSYPTKSVRIVLPFGAGGVADITARTLAQKLSVSLGQPVVVVNKPGAGGIVAGDFVAKSDPDGHTLLLMSNGSAVSVGLFKSLPFDTINDFKPISTLGFFDLAMVTTKDSPFKNLGELLAFAKAQPGKLNIGSVNIGSTQNLVAELFKSTAGIDVQIVPYNGSPAVISALRGGQIDASFEILGPVLPQIKANVLKALIVTGETRAAVLPDVPTAKESGLPSFVAASWNALAVPAKTPKSVIDQLNKEILLALNDPDVKNRLAGLNVNVRPSTPESASALLASEIVRWQKVIQDAKIPKR